MKEGKKCEHCPRSPKEAGAEPLTPSTKLKRENNPSFALSSFPAQDPRREQTSCCVWVANQELLMWQRTGVQELRAMQTEQEISQRLAACMTADWESGELTELSEEFSIRQHPQNSAMNPWEQNKSSCQVRCPCL